MTTYYKMKCIECGKDFLCLNYGKEFKYKPTNKEKKLCKCAFCAAKGNIEKGVKMSLRITKIYGYYQIYPMCELLSKKEVTLLKLIL